MYLVLVLLMRSGRRTYYTPATTLDEDVVPEKRKSKERNFLPWKKTKKSTKNMGFMCPFNAASAG